MTEKPSFAASIAALLVTHPNFPWVTPTDDKENIAVVLESIHAEHASPLNVPDDDGGWGTCTSCGTRWPCAEWTRGYNLAVLWIGRAHDRVTEHGNQWMGVLNEHERTNRRPA